ncbi:DoxX family membrane protein [Devosia sp.]|uniref:DoxX family membrane protein n=1 Tax=Devosia sp. TaxID=1871048 RepID=UPI002AFF9FFF|nr:DoxX family membrane protein [Devosia sp.]
MELDFALAAAGRIIFGLFFLIAAGRNFAGLKKRTPAKTNYGFDLPTPLVLAGFALQLVGGALLVADIATVWGALALIAFLVLATALFHNPLMFPRAERGLHLYLFLVNCTLTGGLLMVIGAAG